MQPLRPTTDTARDQRLWQIAKARTKFQSHLVTYLLVNAGLWLLWAVTTWPLEEHHRFFLPWPIWSTIFWGAAVVAQGLAAYGNYNRGERTQREYERLLNQQQY
ncbi:2TM domain-containing protein [Hymenobacter sp. BT559]|uniref:2TM domain-containing protein n=1 Tax=Hymenobacter sp. BT559 TaxID=2795729 RepID=UPI0018EA7A70|nr:2TM domain-containing protein [Hymenobacter sp. BT559]MBJ6143599.1 2TM domain-containing protein [Hymenobacter sp. BT559]